jgi:hypothetical protein
MPMNIVHYSVPSDNTSSWVLPGARAPNETQVQNGDLRREWQTVKP